MCLSLLTTSCVFMCVSMLTVSIRTCVPACVCCVCCVGLGLLSASSYLVGGAALGATGEANCSGCRLCRWLCVLHLQVICLHCCVGQYAYNRFERWRLAKAVELHYPELAPTADKETREEKSFQSSFVSQTIHPTQIHS